MALQTIGTYTNTVAPSGSASGKSTSISGNTVTVNGSSADNAFGAVNGLDTSAVTGNQVIVNGGTINDYVFGGVATNRYSDSAPVTGNSVTINNGTVDAANGGYASVTAGSGSASVNSNSIFINGGTVNGSIEGGHAAVAEGSAMANGNTVTISGGAVGAGEIHGGFAGVTSGSASASAVAAGNRVNISGGVINSTYIYGGLAEIKDNGGGTAEATHNTVTISGNPVFGASSRLYGGSVVDHTGVTPIPGDAFTSNTLNIHTSGLTVRNVYNFENLNFFLPSNFAANQPVLTVTDNANLTDGNGNVAGNRSSVVNVGIDGASSPLQAGDTIMLISAGTLVTNSDLNSTAKGMQGVSLLYDFDIDISANGKQLLANVTKIGLNPQTKSFSEARLSQLAFTNQGSDLIAGQGLSAALDATARRTNMKETTVFGTLSGGSSRYKTGSHSDVTGLSLITGLAGNSRFALGKLTLGAFFEYGNANYDSYNSFANADSVRGNGKTDYTGGGVLAHFEFNPTASGSAWLESSARFGRATVDFQTNDMTGNLGNRAAFDSNSNYAAAHIGAGYHWNLTKQNGLDLYAQYLWSRQNADTTELTTNETVKFETANSERLRLGSRFVYGFNSHRLAYAGIAWEHEFDGESNASIFGYKQLDTPKLTGDTCKLELGLTLQPTKTCPVTRNFGIQGYTDKREGIAGSVEVRWEF